MPSPVDNSEFMSLYRGRHWCLFDDRRYITARPLSAEAECAPGVTMRVECEAGLSWDGPTGWPVLRFETSLMLWASLFHDVTWKRNSKIHKGGRFRVYLNGEETTDWDRDQGDRFFYALLEDHRMAWAWLRFVRFAVEVYDAWKPARR